MSDGLKNQWGVGAPAKAGSDQQSQQFQAAFQKELAAINEHLQYTAVNAEQARHNPLAARRDALTPTFQATLAKIDPAEPAKAKGIIDKVMADTRALNAEVTKFRKDAEKAFNDWQARQAKFDTAVHQVEELETWEDPKAQALRTLVDGIRKQVNEKKYAPASATVDQLLPKLKPIYDEYVRQKDAKEKYEPALEALKQKLGETQTSSYQKLEPTQKDIGLNQTQMETAAKAKNYVDALRSEEVLSKQVEDYLKQVEELGKQKKAYEDAVAPLQPRLTTGPQPHPKVEPMYQDINSVRGQMEDAEKKEDFDEALKYATDLKAKLDTVDAAVKELEDQKKAFEDIYNPLQPRLDKIKQCTTAEMAPLQKSLADMQDQIEVAKKNEDYVGALSMAKNLQSTLDAYEKADTEQLYVVEYPKGKKQYLTAKELADLKIQIGAKAAKDILPSLQIKAQSYVDWYRDLKAIADDSYIISTVVNFVGGASLPAVAEAVGKQQPKLDALKQIINTDPAKAQDAYKEAADAINDAGKAISNYMDKVDSGGKSTITALQVVEVTCFAVAAAAGAAVLAPVGSGILATAGANAVTGGGFAILQSGVEDGAHNAIMTGEKPISVEDMLKRAGKAGFKGAALGALSAAGGKVSGMVVEKVMVSAGLKSAAVRVIVADIVEGGISDVIQKTIEKAPGLVTGKTTWEEFSVELARAFIEGGIKNTICTRLSAKESFGQNKGLGATQLTGAEIDAWAEGIGKAH